jgi:hypothetical protein
MLEGIVEPFQLRADSSCFPQPHLALVAAVVNGGVEEESEEDHDEGNDDDELLGQDCW